VAKDFKDKMRREQKRHRDKEAARDEILHRKNIDHLKMMEENKLRTMDAQENLEFLRQRKQQQQDYLYKTEYMKHAFNTEVKAQFDEMVQSTKSATRPVEMMATDINPRMIVSWKKQDALFAEVKDRKKKDLMALTHIRPATKEAKEIMHMLYDMKESKKKKEPLVIDEQDPFGKIA